MFGQGVVSFSDPTLRVSRQGETLVLLRGKERVRRIPLREIRRILVFGPVDLTSGALLACLRSGIDISFLTAHGRYRGRLSGPVSGNAPLRIAQFRAATDRVKSLELARSFVAGKIRNQRRLLLQHQRRRRDPRLAEVVGRMRRVLAGTGDAGSHDALRGLEGSAAAFFFQGFGICVGPSAFEFTVRRRRPPPDPVNACLSFGYAVLTSQVESVVAAAGFDPLIGFLHEPAYGRPSLALDLLEEFRPLVVDQTVLRLLNRRQLGPRDFEDLEDGDARPSVEADVERPVRGVHLQDPGRRVFLGALFKRLREPLYYPPGEGRFEIRDILERQAYVLARAVESRDGSYLPFVPR